MGIFSALEFLPAQRPCHPSLNAIGLAKVPVIVKAPNHHMMLTDESFFGGKHCIALLLKIRNAVLVAIKRGLMRDHEVLSCCCGALQNIECGHHRYRHTSYGSIWVACLKRVNGLSVPRYAHLFLNSINNLLRSNLRSFSTRAGG